MSRARPNSPASRRVSTAARSLLASTALLGAGAAAAADFSIGAGVGADRGRGRCVDSFACDRSDVQWKLFVGRQFSDAFDVQAVVFDAGRFKGGDTTPLGTEFGGSFKVRGVGLTGGWRWALAPSWSVAGRIGVAAVRTRFSYADGGTGAASETTAQPLAGVGIGYAITPAVRLSLDYDVSRFKVHKTHGSLQTLGLAAQYSF
ncbi:MAG: outer membrane beta-barrel protein [Burkholderiales bacterium]|nr:outer membrane beta-barrel protein [Burkholderiales bacterium]